MKTFICYSAPLDHIREEKGPGYAPMLGCRSIEYGKIRIDGDNAVQGVQIIDSTGTPIVYIFQLSKQVDGAFKGCWMTDGVVRFDPHAQPAAPKPDRGTTVKTQIDYRISVAVRSGPTLITLIGAPASFSSRFT